MGHGDDRRVGVLPHLRARRGQQPRLDSPEIVGLFIASVCWIRVRDHAEGGTLSAADEGLLENRQFISASVALLLFGAGMMGTLFMIVLAFVNLWGYSELEAALGVTPVPVVALLVAPIVGRLSDRVPPRVLGVPAILAASIAMLWLSGLPAEPDFWRVFGPLALLGAGIGATFPAVMIGRWAHPGPGLGLARASGPVSQVGFAMASRSWGGSGRLTTGARGRVARRLLSGLRVAALSALPRPVRSRVRAPRPSSSSEGEAPPPAAPDHASFIVFPVHGL